MQITQEQLAELCGVSVSTISGIESYHQYPSFCLLVDMAKALKIHPADLFLFDTSKTEDKKLYLKYHSLITNCEVLPEGQQTAVNQLAQSLADASPKYSVSK